uniref:Uncharacterized protein n=1 Tax=Octactis speculum TaxID=3111310 RepID=A0A7S2BWH4_9STRA
MFKVTGSQWARRLLRKSADVSTSSQLEILSKMETDPVFYGREGEVKQALLKWQVLPVRVTCFTASCGGGLEWFRSKGSYGYEAEADDVYGWSPRFQEGAACVKFKGGHSDFFAFDANKSPCNFWSTDNEGSKRTEPGPVWQLRK